MCNRLLSLTLVFVLFLYDSTVQAANCGDYITGNVTLTRDLDCRDGYFALEVAADGVVIDLNGFSITGSRDVAGILVPDFDNVTIRNGSISGFWVGVNANRVAKLRVERINFVELGNGIAMVAGTHSTFQANDFIRTDSAAIQMRAYGSGDLSRNVIRDNEFFDVWSAVALCGNNADNNAIYDNLIWRYQDYGIHLNHADRNNIVRNRILEGKDSSAIRLNSSSYNQITDNAISTGSYGAISILANAGGPCNGSASELSGKNLIKDNRIMNFKRALTLGIGAASSARVEGNRIENNQITDNEIGIYFSRDTIDNTSVGNNFAGTETPIEDFGRGNRY